ncbi:hypothetical protein GMST_19180 [Geomonas silvestris]|uniref:Lipoprotein SmpA/OmlA domain-containing protein n=1 Tax=Geomonas silvestris TaxID=2740184 RepID=A0A6V8MIH3_9BACT|nr:hypothetical protein [Geomonas silvestris]GFO59593.1 hypothetical protein GMST_19180 [Geomonas silvestris]
MEKRLMWPAELALLACLLLSGCLIIPTNYYQGYSRQNTGTQAPSVLKIGTSREEVLLELGEPDRCSLDETEFWYVASKVRAIIILGDRGGEASVDYVHVVRFDKSGRIDLFTSLASGSGEASSGE